MSRSYEVGQSTNLTASGQVGPAAKPVQLIGFYVNSTNAGTIQFKFVDTNGAAVGGAITPAIGFHRYPVDAPGGLYAAIGGTALDVTLFYGVGS